LVDRTISEARLLAATAHPPEIETEGLEAALQKMAGVAEKYHVFCRVVGGTSCPQFEAPVALQLYRVAQTIVERAIRHDKAHHVLVELSAAPEKHVSMTITDRVGYGESLPALSESEIAELQARVRSIGAALEIEHPAGALRLTCRMVGKGPQRQS
jgi:signal transduction histidine kinase